MFSQSNQNYNELLAVNNNSIFLSTLYFKLLVDQKRNKIALINWNKNRKSDSNTHLSGHVLM
jgi:hypothetical protein